MVGQTLASGELSRQYVKLCDLRDFENPRLRARLRDIVPGLSPEQELARKYWEYATLTLFLEDLGKLGEDTAALAVGAGHETVLFWLANRLGRVVAIDIYGEGSFVTDEADETMLSDPDAFAPYPYRKDRLAVHRMDARALEFEDASFDVVFSLSSIEHFGSYEDIEQSAREVGRVLRHGGVAFIVTECYLDSSILDSPLFQTTVKVLTRGRRCGTATLRKRMHDVFTLEEIRRTIINPSGLELVQPIDLTITPETWENVIVWIGDEMSPATGKDFPHIILKARGAPWTSLALALRKS